MSARSPITTHVLDTSRGRPAAGVPVSLSRSSEHDHASWELLAEGRTDADGRVTDLLAPGSLQPGTYRLRFDTATYFAQVGVESFFYPWAEIVFQVGRETNQPHYHVPLLLNPFGYSTYRGS
jgi:5-hydroxyisourate hydrolase